MGGHHDLALLAVDQGEAAQGEAIGPVGLRPVEAGGDRQDAALARVERQGAGVVPLAHPPGPGDVGDGAGRAGGEEAPAGAELGGPVLPLAQADGQRSRSQGDGPPLAPLRPNGLGFGPALDDAGEAVVTGDLEAGPRSGAPRWLTSSTLMTPSATPPRNDPPRGATANVHQMILTDQQIHSKTDRARLRASTASTARAHGASSPRPRAGREGALPTRRRIISFCSLPAF